MTKKLLERYNINTPLKRLDANTEGKWADEMGALFEGTRRAAHVSDAGTPAVSDPGGRLVHAAREMGIEVVAIPGASALTAALSIAGLSEADFVFLGFLPHKKGRETLFKKIAENKRTTVFYESPHRILKTLASLEEHINEERIVIIARELTKMYEEVLEGTARELLSKLEQNPEKQKGEFVVLVTGK